MTTIRDAVARRWDPAPVAGWLFGSSVRGDGDRDSDIDLLFVAPDSCDTERLQQELGALADDGERWTGNQVQIVEHAVASFLALDAGQAPLTQAFRAEGKELVDRCWPAIASAAAR